MPNKYSGGSLNIRIKFGYMLGSPQKSENCYRVKFFHIRYIGIGYFVLQMSINPSRQQKLILEDLARFLEDSYKTLLNLTRFLEDSYKINFFLKDCSRLVFSYRNLRRLTLFARSCKICLKTIA